MRMKFTLILMLLTVLCSVAYGQVTIGSGEEPVDGSLLQLKEKSNVNDDGVNAYKGLVLPRVALSKKNELYPMFLQDPSLPYDATANPEKADYADTQKKATLKKTHTGLTVYNLTNASAEGLSPGLYVWTGAAWEKADKEPEPWQVSGTTNPATLNTEDIYQMGHVAINTMNPHNSAVFHVDAAKDNSASPTAEQLSNDFVITSAGNVGIGTSTPHNSAALDMRRVTTKGLLIPNVGLDNEHDDTKIYHAAHGLLVYNDGTGDLETEGFMYWNADTQTWRMFTSISPVPPHITDLNCEGATLSPANYRVGVPYQGVLRIPYQGGNGSYYTGGSSVTISGLTFTLQDGKLEAGIGELVLGVYGTPTISSPQSITIKINPQSLEDGIEIPFWTDTNGDFKSCELKVGDKMIADVKTVAYMGPLQRVTSAGGDNVRDGYQFKMTTPDGRFSIRAFVPTGNSYSSMNYQIRNNTDRTVRISSNEMTTWGTSVTIGGGWSTAHRNLEVRSRQWGGDADNSNVYSSAGNFVAQSSSNFPTYGDEGAFYDNQPEMRNFWWTINDEVEKEPVFYTVQAMMTSTDTGTINCPDGTCHGTKVFFYIEQITAPVVSNP